MRNPKEKSHLNMNAEREARLDALVHAFTIAVLSVGFLAGVALARIAGWGLCP